MNKLLYKLFLTWVYIAIYFAAGYGAFIMFTNPNFYQLGFLTYLITVTLIFIAIVFVLNSAKHLRILWS
jgi:hypothetical protein